MRRQTIFAIAGAAGALVSGAAWAQNADAVRRLEQQLREFDRELRLTVSPDQPIAERLLLDVGGSTRLSFFSIDDEFSNAHILRQFDTRLYVRADLDGAHRLFGRLRFQYDDWNDGDSFDGDGDDWNDPFAERYWYEFDLRGAITSSTGVRPDYNFNIRGGKQFIQWGSGMTLTGVLHAALVDIEIGQLGITGLAGLTAHMDTVDFDGSRPGFDDGTDRAYFGGKVEWRGLADHKPYAFVLYQDDENDDGTVIIAGTPTRFEYDSAYAGIGSTGSILPNLAYRAEFVYEFGEGLSDPLRGGAQTTEEISAAAGLLGLTYLVRDPNDTRFDFELIAGTGDDDRLDANDTVGGNLTGTKDNSFVALGYVNTGLALAPEPANLLSMRLGASSSPFASSAGLFRDFRIGLDGFLFFKIDENAPLNVPTTNDGFVGGEIDLSIDWRITSDVTASVRYGLFLPGDAMPATQDDIRQFLWVGVTYAF